MSHQQQFQETYVVIARSLNADVVSASAIMCTIMYSSTGLNHLATEAAIVRRVCNRLNIKYNLGAIRNYLNA